MREIKFRGWDKKKNKFHNFLQTNMLLDNRDLAEIADKLSLVLMQFTGLKDKNGKEIYEGDICKILKPFGIAPQYEPEEINWVEDGWAWGQWNLSSALHQGLEILGNIYENPDLLSTIKEK